MCIFDPTISLGDLATITTTVVASTAAILFARWGLIRESQIQHNNNINRDKRAKLQREMDAAKKLLATLTTYQAITTQVIAKVDDCWQGKYSPNDVLHILDYLSANYASLRLSASSIKSDLRASESQIFDAFLVQALAAESILVSKNPHPETGEEMPPEFSAKIDKLNDYYRDFCKLAVHTDKAIAKLKAEYDEIPDGN